MISHKQEARARNMVKRAKRLAKSAERADSIYKEGALYAKANALFVRGYSWLRLK